MSQPAVDTTPGTAHQAAGGGPVAVPDAPDSRGPSGRSADVDPAEVLTAHEGGKIETTLRLPLTSIRDLSIAYTPGVAGVCTAIAEDLTLADRYTWRSHTVAVVTDGSAVLGLGDIGAAAALPVMEGKAMLFKSFGDLDAVPLCIDERDPEAFVATVARLAPSFGGINLEDISAPRCFEIESKLQERVDIPVMHDDQHGTAIVVLAALLNAARATGRGLADLQVVVSGAGAAGVAVTRILLAGGVRDAIVCDRLGALVPGRAGMNPSKEALAAETNTGRFSGSLAEALAGADVFIGLSGGTVPEPVVATMADKAIIFGLANPDPEIHPDVAHRHAAVVATGRSDYPNQINNVLAFPGLFRGAMEAGARRITEGMKLAAASALAELVAKDLRPDYIVPSPFDRRVVPAVSAAVAAAARNDGVTGPRRV